MKDDKLKSYLRNRLGEYTQPADDALWSSIAADALPKKSRKGLFWIIGATSAAAILLLALVVFNPNPNIPDENQQPLLSNLESKESVSLLADAEKSDQEHLLADTERSEQEPLIADAENIIEAAQDYIAEDKAVKDKTVQDEAVQSETEEDELAVVPAEQLKELAKSGMSRDVSKKQNEDNMADGKKESERGVREDKSEMISEEKDEKDKSESRIEESDKEELDVRRIYEENRYLNSESLGKKRKRIDKKMALAVSASGYSISSDGDDDMDVNFNAGPGGIGDNGDNKEEQLIRTVRKRNVFKILGLLSDGNHLPPVNVVVSVRKQLEGRFFVEGGLSYTYLHSKFGKYYNDAQIKMHYLGLQVKGVIMAYNNDKVTLYGNFGVMMEKNIAGRYESRIDSGRFTTFGLQFSLGFAAGMEVKLAGPVGVFVEPGFAYYYDDGEDIAHIREDNPYNYNLQVGLRFNIN